MMRAFTVAAIVALVGFSFMVDGGVWLVAVAVVLAYVRGRMDESERQPARRGGYLSANGEHPYGD